MNTAAATMNEQSWIDVREVAAQFGMTAPSIKNAILEKRFPVPTYKLGKRHVIDKDVLAFYWAERKADGMKGLKERPAQKQRAKRQQRG